MNVTNLIKSFEELATYLEVDGANSFKIRAFRNATRVLSEHSHELENLLAEKNLTSLQGVGPGIADKVKEFAETETMKELEELRAKIPEGVLAMTRVPGLGPKKAVIISRELGIDTLDKLKTACSDGSLAKVKGMGEKTCAKILEGIAQAETFQGRHRLNQAWAYALPILEALGKHPAVDRVDIAGSLRRWKETIGDIDFVVSTKKPRDVMTFFVTLPGVTSVLGNGDTKSSVLLGAKIQADLRCVSEEEYPYALLHFTGSKEHNTKLRARAKDLGLKLNEYGLFRDETDERLSAGDEAEVYKHLNLHMIPHEAREDHGEIEFAAERKFPTPVDAKAMRGIMHMHTTYSDGIPSLTDYAQWAVENDFEWMGIADHSRSLTIAGGMSEETVLQQHGEIDAVNKVFAKQGVRLLKGIECDILTDGELDYGDNFLRNFEFIVASIHSQFRLTEKEQTKRLCRAIENPHTTILGHMTGRMLLIRDGYSVDHKAVIRCAAEHKVAIEVNGNPRRLDMDWRFIRYALDKGVKLSVGPDAHSIDGLDDMHYSLAMMRKAWVTPPEVLNCLSADEFLRFARARR